MQPYHLSAEFVDSEAERSLLVALAQKPDLYFTVIDYLAPETFAVMPWEFEALATAIEDHQPPPPIEGTPAPDPLATAKKLGDLYQRRLLAEITQRTLTALRSDTPATKLKQQLEDGLAEVDQAVRQLRSGQLTSLADLLPGIFENLRQRYQAAQSSDNKLAGITTGFPTLDTMLGGWSDTLAILAAPPGTGKTSLAAAMVMNCVRAGGVGLFVSHEEPCSRLAAKCISSSAGLELKRFEDGLSDPKLLEDAAAQNGPSLRNLFFHEGTSKTTVNEIKAKFLQIQSRTGIRHGGLCVIDYLQLACAGTEADGEFRNVIDAYLGQLQQQLVKRLKISVLLLAAQNRVGQGSSAITSISYGGEYQGDQVFLLCPGDRMVSEPSRAVDLVIGKNRRGGLGTVHLTFNAALGTFTEVT